MSDSVEKYEENKEAGKYKEKKDRFNIGEGLKNMRKYHLEYEVLMSAIKIAKNNKYLSSGNILHMALYDWDCN